MARMQVAEPTPGVVPVHHQIADAIRAQIVSGQLEPDSPVPSAGELADEWKCSVGSARAALDVLTNEGRITGGRGRRKRVRPPAKRIRLTIDFSQRQKDLVLRPTAERAATGAMELTAGISISRTDFETKYSEVHATAELATEFGIEEGAALSRRIYESIDSETGIRLAWSQSFIPMHLIASNPALMDETNEPWPGGHYHQLYTVGIEVDRLVRSVSAAEPTPADRVRWGIQPGVPLLWVRSRTVDVVGRVVELSDAAYPADRVDLVFTEQLERWPSDYPRFAEGQ